MPPAPAAAPPSAGEGAQHWLEQGRSLLAAGQRGAAAQALARALAQAPTRLAAHNLIERHALDGAFSHWMGCNCEIAPADDIYRFFENHPSSLNPLRDYLADGWRTLAELLLLLEQVDRPLLGRASVLEFASGHGRFTRHLVRALGAQRVAVADVVADAVAFARATFGVQAHVSSRAPEALQIAQRYDLVFVLSLFSHLPAATWSRWLHRLYRLLAPGGLLIFSTHGAEAVRRQRVVLDAQGFFFAPASESQALAACDYGTAFTAHGYVLARIDEQIGRARLLHFAPQHFWNHQDAYVLVRP